MRKAPPISTSSPRETITSLPRARAAIVSSTAAALLLTTVAASAPVSVVSSSSTTLSRSPRPPQARSYSRLLGPAIIASRCCSAGSASSARPRLVWITVPVRLMTRRRRGARRRCRRSQPAAASSACASILSGASAPASAARAASRAAARASPATSVWPCSSTSARTRRLAAAGGRSKAGLSGLPSSHARWTRRAGSLASSGIGCAGQKHRHRLGAMAPFALLRQRQVDCQRAIQPRREHHRRRGGRMQPLHHAGKQAVGLAHQPGTAAAALGNGQRLDRDFMVALLRTRDQESISRSKPAFAAPVRLHAAIAPNRANAIRSCRPFGSQGFALRVAVAPRANAPAARQLRRVGFAEALRRAWSVLAGRLQLRAEARSVIQFEQPQLS